MRRRASAWREAVSGPGRALLAMGDSGLNPGDGRSPLGGCEQG